MRHRVHPDNNNAVNHMRNLTVYNWLFLIPAAIIGLVLLAALIIHGIFLDVSYRVQRWYRRRPQSARVIPIEAYVRRYSPRR